MAWRSRQAVRQTFLQRLGELFAVGAYPMVATHDPSLIDGALRLAEHHQVGPGSWEFQMLHGVRTDEQRRLVRQGHRVRVYLPFGRSWYRYTCRRIAERPANLVMLSRALLSLR